jgi:deoxyribonuclease-1
MPRPSIRGMIARTYFYMSKQYNLRLSKQDRQLFEAWNKTYPPQAWEQQRNQQVACVMGRATRSSGRSTSRPAAEPQASACIGAGFPIAGQPRQVGGARAGNAREVTVVGQVGQLDGARQRVIAQAHHEILVRLAFAAAERQQRGKDFQREALARQVGQGQRGVFDHIVKHRDNPLLGVETRIITRNGWRI